MIIVMTRNDHQPEAQDTSIDYSNIEAAAIDVTKQKYYFRRRNILKLMVCRLSPINFSENTEFEVYFAS